MPQVEDEVPPEDEAEAELALEDEPEVEAEDALVQVEDDPGVAPEVEDEPEVEVGIEDEPEVAPEVEDEPEARPVAVSPVLGETGAEPETEEQRGFQGLAAHWVAAALPAAVRVGTVPAFPAAGPERLWSQAEPPRAFPAATLASVAETAPDSPGAGSLSKPVEFALASPAAASLAFPAEPARPPVGPVLRTPAPARRCELQPAPLAPRPVATQQAPSGPQPLDAHSLPPPDVPGSGCKTAADSAMPPAAPAPEKPWAHGAAHGTQQSPPLPDASASHRVRR